MRFNEKTSTKTVNFAGGESYSQSPELELVSILFTSFANDQFYRSADDTFLRLQELIQKCDKRFVAKAAIYARTSFGMRSITHVLASELAQYISGEKWAKDFYNAIIYRPDDMMEILSYHKTKVSNAMKKGFAKAFGKFDRYQLAKYRGEGKKYKLVDVVNIVHPKPTDKNREALKDLIKGKLKSFDTWETELSKSGQADDKDEFKKDVWTKLIREKKIGYFALLRNLRNIIQQAPEVIDESLLLLTDENLIKKSLVLPFRYVTAYKEIKQLPGTQKVLQAINKAVDISLNNVPRFDGETLVVLDVSGSMVGKPAEIGSLFSAILVKTNEADFITFDNTAEYHSLNPDDSTITIANSIEFRVGGTDFHSIFRIITKKYDRVIILSDMQGWIGHNTPVREYNEWKQRTGSNPYVYSFDLNSYGSMQFPEMNVFCLAGFSEKIFDIMKLLEEDKKALINKIKTIEF